MKRSPTALKIKKIAKNLLQSKNASYICNPNFGGIVLFLMIQQLPM